MYSFHCVYHSACQPSIGNDILFYNSKNFHCRCTLKERVGSNASSEKWKINISMKRATGWSPNTLVYLQNWPASKTSSAIQFTTTKPATFLLQSHQLYCNSAAGQKQEKKKKKPKKSHLWLVQYGRSCLRRPQFQWRFWRRTLGKKGKKVSNINTHQA